MAEVSAEAEQLHAWVVQGSVLEEVWCRIRAAVIHKDDLPHPPAKCAAKAREHQRYGLRLVQDRNYDRKEHECIPQEPLNRRLWGEHTAAGCPRRTFSPAIRQQTGFWRFILLRRDLGRGRRELGAGAD